MRLPFSRNTIARNTQTCKHIKSQTCFTSDLKRAFDFVKQCDQSEHSSLSCCSINLPTIYASCSHRGSIAGGFGGASSGTSNPICLNQHQHAFESATSMQHTHTLDMVVHDRHHPIYDAQFYIFGAFEPSISSVDWQDRISSSYSMVLAELCQDNMTSGKCGTGTWSEPFVAGLGRVDSGQCGLDVSGGLG